MKAVAKCSCGASGGTYHTYHTGSFMNYCPHCHHHNTLIWNPKGTVEGEWTCDHCGADYCAADGKEKLRNSGIYLVWYTPKPVKTVKKKEPKKALTVTEKILNYYSMNKHQNMLIISN